VARKSLAAVVEEAVAVVAVADERRRPVAVAA
jgi:hypothetical protein